MSPTGLVTAPATPPPGGVATITARSTAQPSVAATVTVTPVPAQVPAPGGPGTGPVIAVSGIALPKGVVRAQLTDALSGPQVVRSSRTIVVRVTPKLSGTLRVAAIRGGTQVAGCRVQAVMGSRRACRLVLPKRLRVAPVRLAISLRTANGTAVRTVFSKG